MVIWTQGALSLHTNLKPKIHLGSRCARTSSLILSSAWCPVWPFPKEMQMPNICSKQEQVKMSGCRKPALQMWTTDTCGSKETRIAYFSKNVSVTINYPSWTWPSSTPFKNVSNSIHVGLCQLLTIFGRRTPFSLLPGRSAALGEKLGFASSNLL